MLRGSFDIKNLAGGKAARMARKRKLMADFPIRVCNSMHVCCFCKRTIDLGQSYHDGGYSRRAHVECVNRAAQEPAKLAEAAPEGTNNSPNLDPPKARRGSSIKWPPVEKSFSVLDKG